MNMAASHDRQQPTTNNQAGQGWPGSYLYVKDWDHVRHVEPGRFGRGAARVKVRGTKWNAARRKQ